jgi:hypothetical protein
MCCMTNLASLQKSALKIVPHLSLVPQKYPNCVRKHAALWLILVQFLDVFQLNYNLCLNAEHEWVETNVRDRNIHPSLVDKLLVICTGINLECKVLKSVTFCFKQVQRRDGTGRRWHTVDKPFSLR